ncbi:MULTISPECIES: hypothetical protein [unclassified Pseudoxanthomonas]|uniref:hypothetical protein n=1 Tax=unclassified Pseudoxanthomonas TaxID=2645906 RepID=UPI003077DEF8
MDWRYNTIWFEQLPEGQMASVNFGERLTGRSDISKSRYLIARSFKSKTRDFQDFPGIESLLYLHLTLTNATSFSGISKLSSLKRLELTHCLKLESDEGLDGLADSLEWLHINQSKKFSHASNMLKLANLRVLCLNNCAPLQNLSFLSAFPKLVDFRFVGTNVVDGDLTPLLQHPTLCSVRFLDKRHFNLKSSNVEQLMDQRRAAATILAHKGPYETYRYAALGA